MNKALKGMPAYLENVESVKFGKSSIDFICVNTPPVCNYRCEKCFTWANETPTDNYIGTDTVFVKVVVASFFLKPLLSPVS